MQDKLFGIVFIIGCRRYYYRSNNTVVALFRLPLYLVTTQEFRCQVPGVFRSSV